jgi:hypothetical protein
MAQQSCARRSATFAYEHDVRDLSWSQNLHIIEPSLHLYSDEGITSVQFPVGGRFIDILAADSLGGYVVIELKVPRATTASSVNCFATKVGSRRTTRNPANTSAASSSQSRSVKTFGLRAQRFQPSRLASTRCLSRLHASHLSAKDAPTLVAPTRYSELCPLRRVGELKRSATLSSDRRIAMIHLEGGVTW